MSQCLAIDGGHHTSGRAIKQLTPQSALEIGNSLCDRCLGSIQNIRGAGDIPVLGHIQRRFEVPEAYLGDAEIGFFHGWYPYEKLLDSYRKITNIHDAHKSLD